MGSDPGCASGTKLPLRSNVPVGTGQTFPTKTGHRSHDSETPSTVECLRVLDEGRKTKMESSKLTRWVGPAPTWATAFIVCVAADALLGRWVLLPVFVVGFYGGMLIMASLIYPLLERWRLWLRPRGVRAWFLVEVVLWVGIAGGLVLFAPGWLEWSWSGWLPLQASGALLLILSIGASAWALGTMGWPRLLLAAAMFPPGAGAEENHVPQLLVVKGPYRYVRNPIYVLDVGVIFGTALLTGSWWLVMLTVVYVLQLGIQVCVEEHELKARFGATYDRYCRLVPRFIPRLTAVDPSAVHRPCESYGSADLRMHGRLKGVSL
jgi:protein-S-isoprenylcysteine O-methyltransferase Ste14